MMDLFNRKLVANLKEALTDKDRLLNIALIGWKESDRKIIDVLTEISIMNRALGRVIAKVEPLFATPEDDPTRKAASDAAGQAVIDKLRGEDHFSNRTRGY